MSNITLSYTFFPVRLPDTAGGGERQFGKIWTHLESLTTKDGALAKPVAPRWRRQRWRMRMPNRITITTWSIPVRGRRSARPRLSSRPSAPSCGCTRWSPYAPLVLGAGAIGIAYTMVGWWRDVIHEAEVEGDHPAWCRYRTATG